MGPHLGTAVKATWSTPLQPNLLPSEGEESTSLFQGTWSHVQLPQKNPICYQAFPAALQIDSFFPFSGVTRAGKEKVRKTKEGYPGKSLKLCNLKINGNLLPHDSRWKESVHVWRLPKGRPSRLTVALTWGVPPPPHQAWKTGLSMWTTQEERAPKWPRQ